MRLRATSAISATIELTFGCAVATAETASCSWLSKKAAAGFACPSVDSTPACTSKPVAARRLHPGAPILYCCGVIGAFNAAAQPTMQTNQRSMVASTRDLRGHVDLFARKNRLSLETAASINQIWRGTHTYSSV